MRTVTYSLRELLRLARDGGFTIPVFQREFVWKEAQVKLLVDSVSRNFPIGSLLVLAESSEMKLEARPITAVLRAEDNPDLEGEATPPSDATKQDCYYVLDGQQRLTSLVRVFLDASQEKSYYVDLKRLIEQFKENGSHLWKRSASDLPWVRALTRKEPNPERRQRNRYLCSKVILEAEKCQIFVQEYFEDSPDFEGRYDRTGRRKAAAAVNGIFETIRNYQVPIVVIDRESPLEAICRVFETINSTGTRLTTFDLAVARFFPEPKLRTLWDGALREHDILRRFDVDGERLLQVLALWSAPAGDSYVEATRAVVFALDKQFIASHWDRAAACLAEAYEWADDHGASPKQAAPNEGILVALAAFLGKIDRAWRQQTVGFSTVLEKWYFAKLLQAGAWQATNYRVGIDFKSLLGWMEKGQPPAVRNVLLDESALIDIRPSDLRYKTLHALLAMRVRSDLRTGHPLKPEDVEDHHLFPASLTKKHEIPRRRLDSICNRLLVSADTNRHLGDKPPEEYMAEIAREARKMRIEANVDIRLRDAALPGSVAEVGFSKRYSIAGFDQFLHDRASAILGHVRGVIGDALVSGTTQSTDDEDSPADAIDDE